MSVKIEHPVLPYPEPDGTATAGWSGSDASRERARDEAADGTVQKRQREVLAIMRVAVGYGVTVKELRDTTGWHHGQASSVLSSLHKAGLIDRLAQKRMRCHVYVLPEHVNGRDTQPFGRKRKAPEVIGDAGFTREDIDHARADGYLAGVADGKIAGMRASDEDVIRFIDRINAAIKINGPVRAHRSGCYREHPECALKAVANFVERGGALT